MLSNNIKTLIKILEESNIDELEVSTFWGRQKIRIRKSYTKYDQNIEVHETISNKSTLEENINQNETFITKRNEVIQNENSNVVKEEESNIQASNNITIKAPLVGTYYQSSKPDTPPFISEGDEIKTGQIICIIEAMKIFNEIESEYTGKVIKILVEDATPVEYDQDLLIISPE